MVTFNVALLAIDSEPIFTVLPVFAPTRATSIVDVPEVAKLFPKGSSRLLPGPLSRMRAVALARLTDALPNVLPLATG